MEESLLQSKMRHSQGRETTVPVSHRLVKCYLFPSFPEIDGFPGGHFTVLVIDRPVWIDSCRLGYWYLPVARKPSVDSNLISLGLLEPA